MKAVIFDCDGVLVNSTALHAEIMKHAFNQLGLNYTPEQEEDRFAGLTADQRYQAISDDFEAQHGQPVPNGFFARLFNRYREIIRTSLQPMPGVKALVRALDDAGTKLAVASNGDQKYTAEKLMKTGLYSFFKGHIYTAEDVSAPKPAPDLYQLAADELGVAPADCVVVEDSQTGAMAGKQAGSHVIGYVGEHCRVPDMAERLKKAGAAEVFNAMAAIQTRIFSLLEGPPSPGHPPKPNSSSLGFSR